MDFFYVSEKVLFDIFDKLGINIWVFNYYLLKIIIV